MVDVVVMSEREISAEKAMRLSQVLRSARWRTPKAPLPRPEPVPPGTVFYVQREIDRLVRLHDELRRG